MPFDPTQFDRLKVSKNFQKIDYPAQYQIRLELLQNMMATDPSFQKVDGDAKQEIFGELIKKYVAVPPVYEHPESYDRITQTPEGRTFVGTLLPVLQASLIARGMMWTVGQVENLLKKTKIIPKDYYSDYDATYSPDAVKMVQWVDSVVLDMPKLPYTMATVGTILDWVGLSAAGSVLGSAVGKILPGTVLGTAAKAGGGLGITRILTGALGTASTSTASALGRWAIAGASSKLLGTGARLFLLDVMGSAAIRAVGFGAEMTGVELLKHYTSPNIPWAPGTEATAKSIATTFGKAAAVNYLFNVVSDTLIPYLRFTAKSFRKKGVSLGNLEELKTMDPQAEAELVQRIKLGTSDETTMQLLDPGVRDHLTARAEFEIVEKGGAAAVLHDPVSTMKSIGFLLNNEVVDAAQLGTYRIRTSPGTTVRQILAGKMEQVQGGEVLADGVRLPEAQRIIAERYQQAVGELTTKIEKETKAVTNLQAKLNAGGLEPEELVDVQEKLRSHQMQLVGHQMTMEAYNDFSPALVPVVVSNAVAKTAFNTGLIPGALLGEERSAITYGEASAVQAKPTVKTVRFLVNLPEGQLSGKEARPIREGSTLSTVRDVKDFFVRTSDPFTIRPAEGDFNALAVYRTPATDVDWASAIQQVKDLQTPSSPGELAESKLLTTGFDSIEHTDGSVTLLLPRSQVKHVSDRFNPKTGLYRSGFDVGKKAGEVRSEPGLSNAFLFYLGKDTTIKQSLGLKISNKDLAANDIAMVELMKTVYGDVKSEVVKRIAEIYIKKFGGSTKGLEVVLGRDLKPSQMTFQKIGDRQVLTVPDRITSTEAQYDFITNLGELLSLKKRSMIVGKEVGRAMVAEGLLLTEAGPTFSALEQALHPEMQKAIEEATEKSIVQVPGLVKQAGEVLKKNIYASPLPDATADEKVAWLEEACRVSKNVQFVGGERRGGQGNLVLTFSDGTAFHTNDIDFAIDEFLVHNTSEWVLRNELQEAMGYTLERTSVEGKFYRVLNAHKKEIAAAGSIPDLLHMMNFRPARIDSMFAPTTVFVGSSDVTFQVNGRMITGNINQVRKVLDRYVDPAVESTKKTILKSPLGKISKWINEDWEVEIPEWGIRKRFSGDTPEAEVKAYLDGRFQDLEEIERLANERGMMVRIEEGRYKLLDERGSFYAKTKDEVGKILARSPDPGFAPNLLPTISEEEQTALQQSWKDSYAPNYWTLPYVKAIESGSKELGLTNVSHNIKPLHDWMLQFARKTGRTDIAERLRDVEIGRREAYRQENDARKVILHYLDSFKDSELRSMTEYLEQTTTEGKDFVIKELEMTNKMVKASEDTRNLLGTHPMRNPGLFGKAGIDSNKYLFAYLPRVREMAARLQQAPGNLQNLNDSDIEEFLSQTFMGPEHVPNEVKFNAEKERLSELVKFAREKNLLKLLLSYNHQLHMKLFVNPPMKRLVDAVNNSPVPVGEVAGKVLERYREQVLGVYNDRLGRDLKQFGRSLAIKINRRSNSLRRLFGRDEKALSPEAGESFVDLIFTVLTLGTQAFRAWLTIRNVTQIYTTTAALVGTRWVGEGIQDVLKNAEGILGVMRARGSLTEGPPLLNPIVKGESRISNLVARVTESGMKGIQRSDLLTRAAAYRIGERKWDFYARIAEKNPSFDFVTAVGLNTIHEDIGKMSEALWKKGTPESKIAAKHLFADDVMRLTMFDYTRSNAPTLFHGTAGRAFGQYQVFPVYYLAQLQHMASHGTAGQRSGMIFRWLVTSLAAAGAMYALGLDGKQMLPWVPATIGAGPAFTLAWNLLGSFNTTSYQGRSARGELLGSLTRMIPGSYEYRMISDFIKYMEAGKPLLAFYALTSAPIRPDLRIR